MGIGLISTYPPRMCGIASVAVNVRRALLAAGEPYVPVVAMVKDAGDTLCGPEVAVQVPHHDRRAYLNAAAVLNAAPVEAVIVQHEFSIYGGRYGAYLLDLLTALRKPVITVFHTVMDNPPHEIREITRKIAARSTVVVTVSARDRNVLQSVFGLPAHQLLTVPMGVPDPPAGTQAEWKERLGLAGRTVAMTFGLLGGGKGLETVLDAMPHVTPTHPDFLYLVVGTTHPEEKRTRGEAYRTSLVAQASAYGVLGHLHFVDRYLEEQELLSYLVASDIYVTPYPQKGRGSSLTTLYAAFLGKPILSTPFDFAQELLGGGAAAFFPFGDAAALAHGLRTLASSPDSRRDYGNAARAATQHFSWRNIAQQYLSLARALAGTAPPAGPGIRAPRHAPATVPVAAQGGPYDGRIHPSSPLLRSRIRTPMSLQLHVQNTGSTLWSPEVAAVTVVGALHDGEVGRVPIGAVVPPGGSAVIDFHLVAPPRPGLHSLEFSLECQPHGQPALRCPQPVVVKLAVAGK